MNKPFSFFGLIFLLGCSACTDTEEVPPATLAEDRIDYHSYAKPSEAKIKHLNLDLTVDFEQKVLSGFARYDIENQGAEEIVFDARDLNIERVTLGADDTETTFELGDADPLLGAPLRVAITPSTQVVTIHYRTTPDGAAAVDWLAPEQTADKQHPFLFTQGQAILTRTWIPIQDSPGIRITYDATIRVPPALMAVMSATNPQQKNETGVYQFKMEQPIPPYLLALAVGDLQFAAIGARTGVYAEPSVVQAAADEFTDVEMMLDSAEALYGPYLWERYDIIVLPPSFPFGGMENPRLTFATPTIIAGDRSLVALVAHELAHSWSGNLVTNATWNDFWLNEGFTVYFERRIMESLYGEDYVEMLAQLGYQDLEGTVADLDATDTHLFLDLKDRDPDDGMTDIAYEKGAYFLTLLEQKAGRERFDAFLKEYFRVHQFKTITTTEFIAYLQENLLDKYELDVNLEEWIYGPGLPDNIPLPVSERFQQVDAAVEQFSAGTAPAQLATANWTTHEWLHFIRHLPATATMQQLQALDQEFGFADSGNSEIQAAWYQLAIESGYSERIMPQIKAFLTEVGRRKFLMPLYRAFKEHEQLDVAQAIYQEARPNYHSVSRNSLEDLLEL